MHSVEEGVGEIEQVELRFRPGQRGVQPTQPLQVDAFLGDVALVDDHSLPLSTLAFVAGQGVGEFHLQRLVARVGVRGFMNFGLASLMAVVGRHRVV